MRLAAALLLLALASPAFADVVSAGPDQVSVVVYRDRPMTADQLRQLGDGDTSGLAMITEVRTVNLPAGRSKISFQGVADAIIPASATLQGLPGRMVERDFDYDLLDPGALIEKSLGGPVGVRRVNPKTGAVSEEPATLRSGPDGLVVETAHGVEALNCGAGPEALIFDHLPAGLADKPTLSVVADAPAAGRYALKLSYLTVAVDWSADYVARIAPDGRSLDLTGWLTLSNRSGMSFADAPTAVVAGKLARVAPDLPDIAPTQVQPACWPMGRTTDWVRRPRPQGQGYTVPVAVSAFTATERGVVGELVVTAGKRERVKAGQLGDYKLYTLAEPTTLAARQMKQIRFLHLPNVTFDKLYVFRVDGLDNGDETPEHAHVVLSLENKLQTGLGQALPAGMVSVRQLSADDELYVGQNGVGDTPVGSPFELEISEAPDVTVASRVVSDQTRGAGDAQRERLAREFTIANAGAAPAVFELRQAQLDGLKIVAETQAHVLKNAAYVWRITVPANGEVKLGYTAEQPQ